MKVGLAYDAFQGRSLVNRHLVLFYSRKHLYVWKCKRGLYLI